MWNFLTFLLTAILATVVAAGILTLLVELLQRGDLRSKLNANARPGDHQKPDVDIGSATGQRPS